VRDLDVFMEKAQKYLDSLPPDTPHNLDALLHAWQSQREQARTKMLAYLDSKEYQIFKYPGTGHAFNNDSNPARYNAEAAKLAWSRTVEFFKQKLK